MHEQQHLTPLGPPHSGAPRPALSQTWSVLDIHWVSSNPVSTIKFGADSHYESAPGYENSWRWIPIPRVTDTETEEEKGNSLSKAQMWLHIQMSGFEAHSRSSLPHGHPVINSEGWCWTSVTTHTFTSLSSTGHQASERTSKPVFLYIRSF